MELNLFTKDQREFFQSNNDTLNQIAEMKNELQQEKNTKETEERNIQLSDNEKIIEENLAPFFARNRLYEERKENLIKAAGFSTDEDINEETANSILTLQDKMREEVSNLTPDLTMDRTNFNQLDNMFNDNNNEKVEEAKLKM